MIRKLYISSLEADQLPKEEIRKRLVDAGFTFGEYGIPKPSIEITIDNRTKDRWIYKQERN